MAIFYSDPMNIKLKGCMQFAAKINRSAADFEIIFAQCMYIAIIHIECILVNLVLLLIRFIVVQWLIILTLQW